MSINGYSRLVGYDEKLQLVPDILDKYTIEDGRIFTLTLRKGHKWSDGQPVTTEDFRYAYENVMLNEDLNPGGLPNELMPGGKPPKFTVIDDLTVQFAFEDSEPELPAVAGGAAAAGDPAAGALPQAVPQEIPGQAEARGAGQGRQVQELEADAYPARPPEPAGESRAADARSVGQHHRARRPSSSSSCAIPISTGSTRPASSCPMSTSSSSTPARPSSSPPRPAPAKAISSRAISSSRTTPSSRRPRSGRTSMCCCGSGRRARGWRCSPTSTTRTRPGESSSTTPGSAALCRSPSTGTRSTWRSISASAGRAPTRSCRRARCSRNPMRRRGPVTIRRRPTGCSTSWGSTSATPTGSGCCPTAAVAELVVETSGEARSELDVLELVRDHWKDIGIKLFPRSTQRDVFRSRAIAGQVMVAVWSGIDNGVPTADMEPSELAPTSEAQLQWPLWGINFMTQGAKGEAPDIPEVKELLRLLEEWRRTVDSAPRARDLEEDAGDLYRPGVLDRHGDQHAAAGGPPQDPAQCSRQGAVRLYADRLSRRLSPRHLLLCGGSSTRCCAIFSGALR